jgi:outer membrane lipoprotein carrier protein
MDPSSMQRSVRLRVLALAMAAAALTVSVPGFGQRAPRAAEPDPDALAVAEEIEHRYGALRTWRARFEQRYVHRLHRQEERWRGSIAIRRPARFRIDYEWPRRRVVVSDGRRLFAFDPDPAPGVVWEQEVGEHALANAIGLLDGTARLETEFDLRILDARATGYAGTVVELRPVRATPLYERVLLYVDRRPEYRGRVHRMMFVEEAGNTNRFDFTRQEDDVALPGSVFSFVLPASALRVEP